MIIVRTMNAGMCNQLFTYAYARFLAEKKEQEILLDYSHTNAADMKHHAMYEDALSHFDLKCGNIITDPSEYRILAGRSGVGLERLLQPILVRRKNRTSYAINQEARKGERLWKEGIGLNLLAENCPEYFTQQLVPNVVLFGYWQTPQYARQLESILREELIAPVEKEGAIAVMRKRMKQEESVCVHIRRGDYIGNGMHEVCNDKYYHSAMEQYRQELQNPHFYIFSDDKNYVKEHYQSGNDDVTVMAEKTKDYEELILMSGCRHFIISNSSFSWWAQFLSGSKDVIAPAKWYNDANKKSLLYEDFWELLPVEEEQ